MERLRVLQGDPAATDSLKSAVTAFESLMDRVAAFEADVMGAWCARVADVSDTKLKQPLLRFVIVHRGNNPVASKRDQGNLL